MPGIGAYLHVLFRKWLSEGRVDPAKVNYVEVTFPTQNDALHSGAEPRDARRSRHRARARGGGASADGAHRLDADAGLSGRLALSAAPLLEFQNVSLAYGDQPVLGNLSFAGVLLLGAIGLIANFALSAVEARALRWRRR